MLRSRILELHYNIKYYRRQYNYPKNRPAWSVKRAKKDSQEALPGLGREGILNRKRKTSQRKAYFSRFEPATRQI
jgi:hypothetical protein